VDWAQATKIGYSLLLSPLVGFCAAGLLLLVLKRVVRNPALYAEPRGNEPPPRWIRGVLILTCTGVSFAHGSNDGQKGMGLIMLILIGVVPTAYALNRAMPDNRIPTFLATSASVAEMLDRYGQGRTVADPASVVGHYLRARQPDPEVVPALSELVRAIQMQVRQYGSLRLVPAGAVQDAELLLLYRNLLNQATRYIPTWVKIAVAIALGLGTMVGWKRIVVTVGEKIGKSHLTYAQGASAELVAATTIAAADVFGLPVSTTHVLSSGVAGTMAANRSGLQMSTVRNLALAWVLTLPASIFLSATLYWVFSHMFDVF
jgi:PiT family inorganic phosphate transporter